MSGSVAIAASPDGGYMFTNIISNTTTTPKKGAGYFKRLMINTLIASATITIYDNTAASGTKIATITLPSVITGDAPTFLDFDVGFATGLTIVTSGSTDITAVWM